MKKSTSDWIALFEKAKALALNKPEQEAESIFKEHGFITRVSYRDDERFMKHRSLVHMRATLGIRGGLVVEATRG